MIKRHGKKIFLCVFHYKTLICRLEWQKEKEKEKLIMTLYHGKLIIAKRNGKIKNEMRWLGDFFFRNYCQNNQMKSFTARTFILYEKKTEIK